MKKFAFSLKTYSSKELYNKLMRCVGAYVVLACNATLSIPYPFDICISTNIVDYFDHVATRMSVKM